MNTTHYTKQQWQAYVLGEEIGRTSMDAHLAECDTCLIAYMEAVEQAAEHLPQLSDTQTLAQKVMERIDRPPARRSKAVRRSWYMKPLAQYAIAAGLTIVLVGSGAFHQLFQGVSDLTRQAEYSDKATFSEQLTEQADRWLSSIPNKYVRKKEGLE